MPGGLRSREHGDHDHPMTLPQALDLVTARTGVARYRWLCLEHPRPQVRAEYTALVFRLAAEPESARPDPAEQLRLLAEVRSCQSRSAPLTGCGCSGCGLRGGAAVTAGECLRCVRAYPAPAGA
jgi:hypothetical protein